MPLETSTPIGTLQYATQRAAKTSRRFSPRSAIGISAALVILTIASLFLALKQVVDEPYFGGVSESDAWLQVGFAGALIALWLVCCTSILTLVARRKIHWTFLLTLLLAGFAILLLINQANDYLSDLIAAEHMPGLQDLWLQSPSTMPSTTRFSPAR